MNPLKPPTKGFVLTNVADRRGLLTWMRSSWTVSLARVGLFVIGWETIKASAGFPKAVLPHVWEVGTYLGTPTSNGDPFGLYLVNNMGVTFREAVVGLLAGSCCGVVTGTVIGLSRRVGRGLLPLVVASQTVPIIAIAPAIVIWLGTDWLTKAVIAGYLCFFPVAVTTARGFADVSVESLALMRTLNASRLQVFLALRMPSALPMIFVGLETAAAFAVLGSLVGELPVGSSEGVGFVILSASQFYTYAPEALYGAVAGTFVTGIGLVLLIKLIERVMLRNRRSAAVGAS